MKQEKKQEYLSVLELAKLLGVSRVTVFRRIKKGEIKAQKIGRNYAIPKDSVFEMVKQSLSKDIKLKIHHAVKKAVEEYGEALTMLGKE